MKHKIQLLGWALIVVMAILLNPSQSALSYSDDSSLKVPIEIKDGFEITTISPKVVITPGESEYTKKQKSLAKKASTSSVSISSSKQYTLDELKNFYKQAASQFGIDPKLLESVHQVESGKSSYCKTSSAGAMGPMQFLRSTFAHYSDGNICDAKDAIFAAAKLLAANGASDGDIRSALYSYNHSQKYVNLVISVMDSIPS